MKDFRKGITISAPGFYAPQGRRLRLETFDNEINNKLAEFSYRGRTISNYEMESSAIYGLSALLGHKALTICLVIGNRVTGEFVQDYKPLMSDLAFKGISDYLNHLNVTWIKSKFEYICITNQSIFKICLKSQLIKKCQR